MILKASERSGARSYANHLLNKKDNDHIEVYDIRGLAAEKLHGAFLEIDAVSQGTRATKPFFVVAFNPPENANVTIDQFEAAIAKVEKKLGLAKQPRAIVFHEKEGRRHAHVLWSRIYLQKDKKSGEEKLRAKNMSHWKKDLKELSLGLFKEHGWEIPKGLQNKKDRDPLNFDLQTWQQAKRLKEDPRDLKRIIHEALKASDGAKAFAKALEVHGLQLAAGKKGKRSNFLVVHHSGEVMDVARYSSFKVKEVRAILGNPEAFPSVEQVQETLKTLKTAFLKEKINNLKKAHRAQFDPLKARLKELRIKQRAERKALKEKHQNRWAREELARAKRLRKGILGLVQRLFGHHGKIIRENKQNAEDGLKRDNAEKQKMINRHLKDRRALQEKFKALKLRQNQEMAQARFGIGAELKKEKGKLKKAWQEKEQSKEEKSLSEAWRETSGSRSGGGKAPPLQEAFNDKAKPPKKLKEEFKEKSKKEKIKERRKRKKEKEREENQDRTRTRQREPNQGPGR